MYTFWLLQLEIDAHDVYVDDLIGDDVASAAAAGSVVRSSRIRA